MTIKNWCACDTEAHSSGSEKIPIMTVCPHCQQPVLTSDSSRKATTRGALYPTMFVSSPVGCIACPDPRAHCPRCASSGVWISRGTVPTSTLRCWKAHSGCDRLYHSCASGLCLNNPRSPCHGLMFPAIFPNCALAAKTSNPLCSVCVPRNRLSQVSLGGDCLWNHEHSSAVKNGHIPFSTSSSNELGACDWTPEDDKKVLEKTKRALEECGWYYGVLSHQDASNILSNTAEGTFLVRDSASGQCRYSLSVQTSSGPTSIRIEYDKGNFRLACDASVRKGMLRFQSPIDLVHYYITCVSKNSSFHSWVDYEGKPFSPITVRNPLLRKPQSLQHLSRLVINSSVSSTPKLPSDLQSYLASYPYKC